MNKPGISSTYAALHFSETAETNMSNKCREKSWEQEPKKKLQQQYLAMSHIILFLLHCHRPLPSFILHICEGLC